MISSRKTEAQLGYQRVLKAASLHSTNWEKWLETWEHAVYECEDLGPPEASPSNAAREFYIATQNFNAVISHTFIGTMLDRDEENIDIYAMAEKFRNHMRLSNPVKTSTSKGAFAATYQGHDEHGEKPEASGSKQTSRKGKNDEKWKCPCGNHSHYHKIKTCWYFVDSEKKPDDWIPRDHALQKIEEACEADAELRKYIDDIKGKKDMCYSVGTRWGWLCQGFCLRQTRLRTGYFYLREASPFNEGSN